MVAWAPDSRCVASGDMDGTIYLWDPKTGKPCGVCRGHRKWITSLVGGSRGGQPGGELRERRGPLGRWLQRSKKRRPHVLLRVAKHPAAIQPLRCAVIS